MLANPHPNPNPNPNPHPGQVRSRPWVTRPSSCTLLGASPSAAGGRAHRCSLGLGLGLELGLGLGLGLGLEAPRRAAPLTMGVSTYSPWPCLLLPCLLLTLALTLNLTLTRPVPPGGSLSRRCLAARRGASRGRRAGLCSRSACSNWEAAVARTPPNANPNPNLNANPNPNPNPNQEVARAVAVRAVTPAAVR